MEKLIGDFPIYNGCQKEFISFVGHHNDVSSTYPSDSSGELAVSLSSTGWDGTTALFAAARLRWAAGKLFFKPKPELK